MPDLLGLPARGRDIPVASSKEWGYQRLKDGSFVWHGPAGAELEYWRNRAIVAEGKLAGAQSPREHVLQCSVACCQNPRVHLCIDCAAVEIKNKERKKAAQAKTK
jgi:hypothetical protein